MRAVILNPSARWRYLMVAIFILFTGWDEGWAGHGWPITGGEAPLVGFSSWRTHQTAQSSHAAAASDPPMKASVPTALATPYVIPLCMR